MRRCHRIPTRPQKPTLQTLLESYADFLDRVCQDYDQAEQLYQRATEAETNDSLALGNYADFLYEIRGNHDQAEPFYRRTIEADPDSAYALNR